MRLLGLSGIVPRTRRRERIAAKQDPALDVAAYTAEIFEAIVVGLEFLIGDAAVLDLRPASRNLLPLQFMNAPLPWHDVTRLRAPP